MSLKYVVWFCIILKNTWAVSRSINVSLIWHRAISWPVCFVPGCKHQVKFRCAPEHVAFPFLHLHVLIIFFSSHESLALSAIKNSNINKLKKLLVAAATNEFSTTYHALNIYRKIRQAHRQINKQNTLLFHTSWLWNVMTSEIHLHKN